LSANRPFIPTCVPTSARAFRRAIGQRTSPAFTSPNHMQHEEEVHPKRSAGPL